MLGFAHRSRKALWLFIFTLLFAQIATAAYACSLPLTGTGPTEQVEVMPGCSEHNSTERMMDPAQPGLCVEHCKPDATAFFDAGNGSSQLGSIVLTALYPAPIYVPQAVSPPTSSSALVVERPGSPSLSVLHCCFRI